MRRAGRLVPPRVRDARADATPAGTFGGRCTSHEYDTGHDTWCTAGTDGSGTDIADHALPAAAAATALRAVIARPTAPPPAAAYALWSGSPAAIAVFHAAASALRAAAAAEACIHAAISATRIWKSAPAAATVRAVGNPHPTSAIWATYYRTPVTVTTIIRPAAPPAAAAADADHHRWGFQNGRGRSIRGPTGGSCRACAGWDRQGGGYHYQQPRLGRQCLRGTGGNK